MKLQEIINSATEDQSDEDDFIELIWKQPITVKEKIELSLELFDRFPTYYVLMIMWLNYRIEDIMSSELTNGIFQKYQEVLSKPSSDSHDSLEYSLFFDLFQSPELQMDAWNYFLENEPNEIFLKTILHNAAPIPYPVKDKLYQSLIVNVNFHVSIYRSIRDSCTYTRG